MLCIMSVRDASYCYSVCSIDYCGSLRLSRFISPVLTLLTKIIIYLGTRMKCFPYEALRIFYSKLCQENINKLYKKLRSSPIYQHYI